VVVAFLIGCAVLLVGVGCAGTRSETSKEEQAHTEFTTNEQTRSSEATASEEARCEGTRTYQKGRVVRGHRNVFTTNDLPDCPKGGLLLGTDRADKLGGKEGDDEIRGLGASDQIFGGVGDDLIYGGPGDDPLLVGDDGDDVIHGGAGDDGEIDGAKGDDVIYGGGGDDGLDGARGKDVIYGGDGNDSLSTAGDRGQRDELYCGKGKDEYNADENDFVGSSCEEKYRPWSIV
jgi:hypothetical protein